MHVARRISRRRRRGRGIGIFKQRQFGASDTSWNRLRTNKLGFTIATPQALGRLSLSKQAFYVLDAVFGL